MQHPKGHLKIGKYMTAVLRCLKDQVPKMMAAPDGIFHEIDEFTVPELKHVAAYPMSQTDAFNSDIEIVDVPDPAVLIDLESAEPAEDGGTNTLDVNLMMNAYVIVGESTKRANLIVRIYAFAVATAVRQGNRFGAPVGDAEIREIVPVPHVVSENRSYIAWAVKWRQPASFGDSTDLTCPDPAVDAADVDKVMLGFEPKTGPANINYYEQVNNDV